MASKTGVRSPGDELMTWNTSEFDGGNRQRNPFTVRFLRRNIGAGHERTGQYCAAEKGIWPCPGCLSFDVIDEFSGHIARSADICPLPVEAPHDPAGRL